jgi:hypothetical protein
LIRTPITITLAVHAQGGAISIQELKTDSKNPKGILISKLDTKSKIATSIIQNTTGTN